MSGSLVEKKPYGITLGHPSLLAVKFMAVTKKVYQNTSEESSSTFSNRGIITVTDGETSIDSPWRETHDQVSITWSYASRLDVLGLEVGCRVKIGKPKLVTFVLELQPVAVTPAGICAGIAICFGVLVARPYLPNNIISSILSNFFQSAVGNVES